MFEIFKQCFVDNVSAPTPTKFPGFGVRAAPTPKTPSTNFFLYFCGLKKNKNHLKYVELDEGKNQFWQIIPISPPPPPPPPHLLVWNDKEWTTIGKGYVLYIRQSIPVRKCRLAGFVHYLPTRVWFSIWDETADCRDWVLACSSLLFWKNFFKCSPISFVGVVAGKNNS